MQAGQLSRIAVALGAALALAAGLAACGPRAEDQPLQLKGGVPVGAVLSLTSNANAYGQDQQIGLKLAQTWFQQRRNANPQEALELNLRLEDGGGDEATASQAFNLLIDAGVVALIGPTLSQQAFAADPIAQRRSVPVVAPSNTATGIPQIGSFISRVSAPSTEIAPLSIAKALQLTPSIRRAAVFYAQDDAYSTSETVIFQKALTDKGLKPVTVQRTQLNDQDFQNQISSALRESPDLIVISAQAVDGGNLIRQLRELGYRGAIVVGNGMNTPNIYPICQGYCDGILIAQAYSPELDTPVNRDFVALYQEAKGGAIPPQLTAQAFTAYQVVAEALQRLNQRQPLAQLSLAEARKALLAELLGGQYDTPLGEISFSPDGEVLQQRFHVAQVRMQPDGRSGRFLLLP
ncbi:ABC transporter substrate-binding protein [Synechococcus sp. Cruz-9H2]|uniref:ABC transporter substrate-binding protein n=1 Tax=unclassified Synechococcus TaxID=2626047 RepID=UPI0020CE7D6A|nr:MULTISPECIES: ABC transporter substrate-binding protein [unclassified Synechococcus]MCP9820137.1 ABC transporter substrate-binding protein [Synechococcus sp. Cruz-9H2]MCP9844436.1 ABC transporter substrate-binding protein [Synechococcus sp. Edmonson 11F2]MCP9856567.1 ABC transporter substrate-binding protein [Synechococcus sp. Cruz-9C9]MCP9863852.1 ABC transporter substrate-binding protein [Synechococcus sp. Cruz-7E5]MCP9871040.1 ABC transporter substrate-binding protein [Synechococcus sp. 